ncbi:MAG: DUF5658 family protein [Methanomicrobiales archaeon]
MGTAKHDPQNPYGTGALVSPSGRAPYTCPFGPTLAGHGEGTLTMRPYHLFVGMLIGILGMLLFLDVLTTTLILDLGGTELNPVMQPVVGNPLIHLGVKVTFAGFVMFIMIRAERMVEYSGAAILTAVCSFFGVVFVHNLWFFIGAIAA